MMDKYALLMNPLARSLEELLPTEVSNSNWCFFILRTSLVISTVCVAFLMPFFGKSWYFVICYNIVFSIIFRQFKAPSFVWFGLLWGKISSIGKERQHFMLFLGKVLAFVLMQFLSLKYDFVIMSYLRACDGFDWFSAQYTCGKLNLQ